ncbi:hypothetical protein BT69DRAFT_261175 [Atractiella rhizophila]|nr:hypothetical protein BT69DRAFT_261175 [Atractiella rhizophila]
MDVDRSPVVLKAVKAPTPAGDKLADLFENSTSPVHLLGTTRKRALCTDDDSFTSPSSPLASQPPRSRLFEKTSTLASINDRSSLARKRLPLKRPSMNALQPPITLKGEHNRTASQRELGLGLASRQPSRDPFGQPATKIMRRAYSICDAPLPESEVETLQVPQQQRVVSADFRSWNAPEKQPHDC